MSALWQILWDERKSTDPGYGPLALLYGHIDSLKDVTQDHPAQLL